MNLYFGETCWHRWNAFEDKLTQFAVVLDQVALALVHGNFEVALPVYGSGVASADPGWDFGVTGQNHVH